MDYSRDKMKDLIVDLERLMKAWHYTTCGDKQAAIALDLSLTASMLMEMGLSKVFTEDFNGNLKNLDLETLAFE